MIVHRKTLHSFFIFLLLCPYFGKVDKNNEYTMTAYLAKKLI